MSGIMVLLDGAADLLSAQLTGMDPLDSTMASWREGQAGEWFPCPMGREVGTLTGVATLLGVPPEEIPSGRAWLEAMAENLPEAGDEYALRCNLISVDREGRLVSAQAKEFSPLEKQQAFAALQQGIPREMGRFYPLGDYRGVLLLKGMPRILRQGLAPHQNSGVFWQELLPIEVKSPVMLSAFTHIANGILKPFFKDSIQLRATLWSGSGPAHFPPFSRRHGFPGAVISATAVVRGLGKAMGMDVPSSPRWTGDTNTDLLSKGRTALELASEGKWVLLHLNGADEASHRRSLTEKTAFLTRVERELMPLLKGANVPLLLCTDHGTNSTTGEHFGGPQSFRIVNGDFSFRPTAAQAADFLHNIAERGVLEWQR